MPEGHPEVRLRRTAIRSRVTPRPLVQTQPHTRSCPRGLKASASNPLIAVHVFLFNSISFTLRSSPASLGHCRDHLCRRSTLSSGSDWMLRTGRRLVSPHHPHRALITLRVRWSRPHIARDTNELLNLTGTCYFRASGHCALWTAIQAMRAQSHLKH